jgi:hypothetical protein
MYEHAFLATAAITDCLQPAASAHLCATSSPTPHLDSQILSQSFHDLLANGFTAVKAQATVYGVR